MTKFSFYFKTWTCLLFYPGEVTTGLVVVEVDGAEDGAGHTVPVIWLIIQDSPADTLEYTPDQQMVVSHFLHV
jgi:hypothetical protein